jgi:hypothetical protein
MLRVDSLSIGLALLVASEHGACRPTYAMFNGLSRGSGAPGVVAMMNDYQGYPPGLLHRAPRYDLELCLLLYGLV